MLSPLIFLTALLAALAGAGCASLALTAAGIGGSVAAGHQMGGIAFRTFTAPLPRVRSAVLAALKKMAINPDKTEKIDLGEHIMGKTGDRSIDIELEAVTANTTRMRAVVRREGGLVVDAATAMEIINQTAIALGRS